MENGEAPDRIEVRGVRVHNLRSVDVDIYASTMGGRLGHYRDSYGREIDATVDLPDGNGPHSESNSDPTRSMRPPKA